MFTAYGIAFGMQEIGKSAIGASNNLVNPSAQVILVIHGQHSLSAFSVKGNLKSHCDKVWFVFYDLVFKSSYLEFFAGKIQLKVIQFIHIAISSALLKYIFLKRILNQK
ncbi:hypothetical protein MASR2M47_28820 [Draconibacterium sp.]